MKAPTGGNLSIARNPNFFSLTTKINGKLTNDVEPAISRGAATLSGGLVMRGIRSSAIAILLCGVSTPAIAQDASARSALLVAAQAQDVPLATTSMDDPSVNGSWGKIRGFWGKIRPFEITTFWAGSNAFATSDADLAQFWGLNESWGKIRGFWGKIRGFWEGDASADGLSERWGKIRGFWADGALYEDELPSLQSELDDFIGHSRSFWNDQIQSASGGALDFDKFFAQLQQRMQERHGFTFGAAKNASGLATIDAGSIAQWDDEYRARFIVEWYDGLMSFSGADHVDHWMKTVKWTPAITEVQGSGADAVIGLLDSVVTGDADLKKKIAYQGGNGSFSDGHGAAVLSLIAASHDGKGVMGIAPNAKVAAYNPFDSTGTASWHEVGLGLKALASNGAHIFNLSLGVPGWTLHPGWVPVLSESQMAKAMENRILVFAAGNDGITQTQNISWDIKINPHFIVVGSASPDGNISSFSNRPGDVCASISTSPCDMFLRDRFVLAPGELILVSDDKGGVRRYSGTSFSAPLVAGAIALLHDRWPWLKKYPKVTSDIILRTARPVYGADGQARPASEVGRGLLDIEASQSPLQFDSLTYYEYSSINTVGLKKTANQLLKGGLQEAVWEAGAMYFTAFEKIDNTHRDFSIPLSSKLVGQSYTNSSGSRERFQQYIYGRMVDWIKAKAGGFTNELSVTAPVQNRLGWDVEMTVAAPSPAMRLREDGGVLQSSLRLATPSGRFGFRMGHGEGAFALNSHPGFGLYSDYDVRDGGVNPVLGFASGGAYGSFDAAVANGLKLTVGLTRKRQQARVGQDTTLVDQILLEGLTPYEAGASHVSLAYEPIRSVTISAAYTRLKEETGLLGIQSLDKADLVGGTRSEGATIGINLRLGGEFNLAGSATLARTHSANKRQNLAVSDEGLTGSAFELAVSKERVLGNNDRVRLSLAQPLYVESGYLDFTSIKVTDRETGEIGPVTERFDISGSARPFVAEILYGAALLNGRAEMSAFGRAERRGRLEGQRDDYMAGARFSFSF